MDEPRVLSGEPRVELLVVTRVVNYDGQDDLGDSNCNCNRKTGWEDWQDCQDEPISDEDLCGVDEDEDEEPHGRERS